MESERTSDGGAAALDGPPDRRADGRSDGPPDRASDPTPDRPSTAGWNWPPILVLGRDTCEDTTRSRRLLESRGIPYDYRRVDREPEADEWIRRLNDDVWVTPTILIGDPQSPSRILREPSDEELDAAVSPGGAEANPG